MQDRIVVTGMGTINPLGHNVKDTWENVINGKSGVSSITLFDSSEFSVQIACEVKDFNPAEYLPIREARRQDRFEQFALVSAQQAIEQADLENYRGDPGRVGVIVSSAIGGIKSVQDAVLTIKEKGPRRVSPFVIPMLMSNGAAGLIGIEYGFMGPSFSIASACASGADGIGIAWMMLKAGVIDIAVTGASEATITPIGIGAFDRLGALSRRNQDYSTTPQPFDENRDGLVMGEGCAILIMEKESHARNRNVEIIAEVAGYGSTADAYHITAPSEDGVGGARAIGLAMQSAGVNPEEIDYINAHGTATKLNDVAETRAIKSALQENALETSISSTKSMTGHIMGATGALEAIFCIQAIRESVIPPTINYQTPDPECDLDYVPNHARKLPINIAMSNAFGFGGHNAVLVVRRFG